MVDHVLHHVGGEVRHPRIEQLLRDRCVVADDIAGRGPNTGQSPRLNVETVVGENGVGSRHIERRRAVRANRHRRRSAGVPHSGIARQRCHAVEAHQSRQADGCIVQRLLQCVARGYFFVIQPMVIPRSVFLIAHLVRRGLVAEHGDRRKWRGLSGQDCAFNGRVKRCRVDEWLEDGASRPFREGMVQLRGAVAAPAHEREHLARMWIQSHERHLRIGPGFPWLGFPVEMVHLFIDKMDICADRSGGHALQIWIERRVNAQPLAVKVAFTQFLQKLIVNQVDEVGCLACVYAGFR